MSLLRRFTDFILQSRSRAFGVAFIFAYIPLLGSISALIAALVTLRKGALEGALIFFAATLPFLLSYYVMPAPADQMDMALIAVGIIIVSNVLLWLYAVLLRQYGNWSLILEFSALLSVVVVVAVHCFNPDIGSWWGVQLTAYFTKTASTMMMNGAPNIDIKAQLEAVNLIKSYATGLAILSIFCNGLLQLALARWWQAIMFASGTLRQELSQIHFGYVMGASFVAILLLSFLGNATALDLKPVFYGLFFIMGLSLVHCLLASVKYSWFWLVLVYVALVVFFPKSEALVAVFALLDVLLNVRRRLSCRV